MKISITSEKEVTIKDLLKEANEIWRLVRANRPKSDTEELRLLEEINRRHPQFYQAYSFIVKLMCAGSYHKKAFRLWLAEIKRNPWRNREEYIAALADYAGKLYKFLNPHASPAEITAARDEVHAELKKEHEVFQAAIDQAQAKVENNIKRLKQKNAAELADYICSVENFDGIGTIQVKVDDQLVARQKLPKVDYSAAELPALISPSTLLD